VQEDIEQQLAFSRPYRQVTGFNRPNLRFDAQFTPGDTLKQQVLKEFLDAQPPEASGVIYVGRRKDAEEIARFVGALCNRQAVRYHGGLLGWERDKVQNEWMEGRAPIVVATNAFGMGVDKPGVRFVVHYTLPGTVEAYYQEAGRAGRDGDPAHCLLLHDPADARLHEWFIENDAPGLEELRNLYRHLMDESRRNGGIITGTSGHFAAVLDWKADGKARVGLSLLEQAGLLENRGEQGGSGCWRLLRVEGRVDMRGLLRDVEARRALRRKLLATMMEYAQTHECRRQYLLDYFGDPTPPLAEWCCDNCRREEQRPIFRAAASPAEKAPLWVLDAVSNLRYGVGRALLAKILAGGRGATMARYFEHPQYGILRHIRQKEIQHLIDELIRERYLLIESGQYPTLALSPSGKQAVEGRLALPVGAGLGQPTAVRHVSPERLSNTAAESHRLFKQGNGVAEVAEERGLTVNTIFNHLASLIEQGTLPVEEVVPDERRLAIEAAVEEVGSFFLSPIKARLPEEIEYGEIRCVVAAIRRDQQVEPTPPPPEQHELYTRLMQWRRDAAHRINQPPYFIFSNAVLHAISMAMPRTLDALEDVRGVGPHKRDEYGETILRLVDEVAGGPS
jgi:ATP-dependent DNA helicase RecQ